MSRVEERIDVLAPPAAVWEVMHDVLQWPAWTPTVSAVKALGGSRLTVGAKYRLKQPKLPPVEWTVTELVPGRSFAWTSKSPGVRSFADHRIEPAGEGSTVVLVFEQSGPLAGLSALFYSGLIRRYVRTEVEHLKRTAERRTPADA